MSSRQQYIGPLQPTKSRSQVSRVWSKTTRPGPAAYTLPSGMGSQPDSAKRSTHGNPFGTDPRLNTVSNAGYSRGPAQSLGEPGVGKPQVCSHHPNAPKAHFGTSSREHTNIMYSAFTYKPQ